MRTAALLSAILFLFTGCLKDECSNRFTLYRPIYQTLAEVRREAGWEAPRKMEQPGKIYLYNQYLLVNDIGKGIHVFDNSDPARPQAKGFLRLGGNVDMAIRNNVLYADSYADLAVIPVHNWQQAKPVAYRSRVFNHGQTFWQQSTNPDSVKVIVGYETRDTLVNCETVTTWGGCSNCMVEDASGGRMFTNAAAAKAAANGTGGSMARFTLVADHLYAVTSSDLMTFSLRDPLNPALLGQKRLGWDIETIFPLRDKLFIGSMTGMFIFDVSNLASPAQLGTFSHARRCDPVVADDRYAYVTLRSGTNGNFCAGNSNELNVVDVANLMQPQLVKSYPLTSPYGLSKDDNLLFVCDGKDGLKVYDATNPAQLKLLQTLAGIGQTYDVIAHNQIALVVTDRGFFQYNYTNPAQLRLLSQIAFAP